MNFTQNNPEIENVEVAAEVAATDESLEIVDGNIDEENVAE